MITATERRSWDEASIFTDSLLRGDPPHVFEDGCQRRTFIHVSDVAAAVLAALRAQLPAGLTPLNIGTPWVMTIGEMATELSRELSGPPPVVTGEYRLGDVRHITTDRSPRSTSQPASPTCQRWSPEQPLALTSRLRDEDQLSASVSVLDDLVRLRCSLERERLEFDHQLALFQQFGRLRESLHGLAVGSATGTRAPDAAARSWRSRRPEPAQVRG